MKIKYVFIIGIIAFLIGFLFGRKTIHVEPEIKYVKQEVVSCSIHPDLLIPVSNEKIDDIKLPVIPVVIWKDSIRCEYMKVDTAAIIADYLLTKKYQQLLFDNKYGELSVDIEIGMNRLNQLSYSFTPITEVKTVIKERVWLPFLSAGYHTNSSLLAGGGMFYHNIGILYQLSYNLPDRRATHGINLLYKF